MTLLPALAAEVQAVAHPHSGAADCTCPVTSTPLADRPDATVVRHHDTVAKAHAPGTDPAELALRLATATRLPDVLLPPLTPGPTLLHDRLVTFWPYGTPVDPDDLDAAPWEAAAALLARLHRTTPPEGLPPMRGPAKAARAMARLHAALRGAAHEAAAPDVPAAEPFTRETAGPEVLGPETVTCQGAGPEAFAREAIGPEVVARETAGPEAFARETVGPEAFARGTVGRDAVAREVVGSEVLAREAVGREALAREGVGPEVVARETAGRDASAREGADPEVRVREAVRPEAAAPVLSAWAALPAWARAEAPMPGAPALCHGDLHLGQLVRHPASRGPWRLIDVDDLGTGVPAWDLARPAAWYACGLLPPDTWARFLGAYRRAGGPAVPATGDPWPALDVPARALTAQTAALALSKALAAGRPLDEVEQAAVDACARMVPVVRQLAPGITD